MVRILNVHPWISFSIIVVLQCDDGVLKLLICLKFSYIGVAKRPWRKVEFVLYYLQACNEGVWYYHMVWYCGLVWPVYKDHIHWAEVEIIAMLSSIKAHFLVRKTISRVIDTEYSQVISLTKSFMVWKWLCENATQAGTGEYLCM